MCTDNNPPLLTVLENEYSLLHQFREASVKQQEEYLKIFLTITAGVTAIIALYPETQRENILFIYICIFAVTFLLICGLSTFLKVISSHVSAVRYARDLNLIRGRITDLFPDTKQLFRLPKDSKQPRYGRVGFIDIHYLFSGYAGMIMFLNTGFAVIIYLLFSIIFVINHRAVEITELIEKQKNILLTIALAIIGIQCVIYKELIEYARSWEEND